MNNTQTSILVVEDDPMVRRLLARHFGKTYGLVTEAPDAEQALAAFQSDRFDVVVTDVHLPGMTGVEMATRIRELRHDQPIVFVTGDVDETMAKRALEGGSAGYLLKPFEFFELDAAIAQAVQAPATAPVRPAAASFSPEKASIEWLEEQRRQLFAAAAHPVTLTSDEYPKWHSSRPTVYLKIAAVVLVLVGLAWFIGYTLFEEKRDAPGVVPAAEAPDKKTVYVPYAAPPAEPPPERTSSKR